MSESAETDAAAALTAIRERMDALAVDLASAQEEALSFQGALVAAVNLYSEACDDINRRITPSGQTP